MSRENEERKAKLQAEIEDLEMQRAAQETELQALESEAQPKVYQRSYFDTLSSAQQNSVVSELQAGTAQLID